MLETARNNAVKVDGRAQRPSDAGAFVSIVSEHKWQSSVRPSGTEGLAERYAWSSSGRS
jgi:hypothetical protein